MTVLCVSYDLNTKGQLWHKIDELLKGYGGGRALETFWLVETDQTPEQLYGRLKPFVDGNDKLIIFRASAPAIWVGLGQQWTDWLKTKL